MLNLEASSYSLKLMSARKVDIERLERDFRAGTLTVPEIARLHGCSVANVYQIAKRRGWTRDLSSRVQERTAAKLAAEAERALTPAAETEVVEQAADVRVAVVLGHRKRIGQLQRIVDNLHAAIERQSEAHADFEPTDDKDRIIAALTTPHAIAKTAQLLADTQAKLITMERQAFSIADESAPAEKPYEERLKELVGGQGE